MEEYEKKIKEKEEVLNAVKIINELIKNPKKIFFETSKLNIEQIISFKLNAPNMF